MGRTSTAKIKEFFGKLRNLWDERRYSQLPNEERNGWQRFAFFVVLVVKRFFENRNLLRASALAYTTLLAMIPLLAVALSVTTSLLEDKQDLMRRWIDRGISKVAPALNLVPKETVKEAQELDKAKEEGETPPRETESPPSASENLESAATPPDPTPDVDETDGAQVVAGQIQEYIRRINSGTLGVTSVFILLLVALALLSTIETTLNDIWGVTQGRTWFSRLVYYWALISLGPVIFVLLVGSQHSGEVKEFFRFLPFTKYLFEIFTWILFCLGFGAFYFLMPNTKVNWKAALIGGIVGGSFWQLNNMFSSLYFSRVVTYTNIYGALGMLPIFLVSLYFSWIFVLLGAQVSYVFQNFQTYLQEEEADRMNQHGREFIALRVMVLVGRRFLEKEDPPTSSEIASRLSISSRLVTQVVGWLSQAGLLAQVTDTMGYMPGRPLDSVTAYDVLEAMRAARGHQPATKEEPERNYIRSTFDAILEAERREGSRITMADMITRCRRVKDESETL